MSVELAYLMKLTRNLSRACSRLRRFKNGKLSLQARNLLRISGKHQMTFCPIMMQLMTFYHEDVIRSKLIRDIPTLFKDIYDELVPAIDDSIPAVVEGWVKVPIVPTLQQVICRISNRIFVGAPLCRNRDYQALNMKFAINVMKFSMIIRIVVMRIISNLPSQVQQNMEFLRPLFEERIAKMGDLNQGGWDDRPNDMLMWLMSEAKGIEQSLEGVARRMFAVNFASIHTTSLTLTQVFYRLLANPQYIEPLRREVEAAVEEEGWTKAGLDKMYKIDSFLRETQRVDGLGLTGMDRHVLRPFTFSNGVTVPAGTVVMASINGIHTDADTYSNPEFDGFRFARLRESDEVGTASKHQAGIASSVYLPFGYGRYVW
ncbi:cytochrome P450 [Russula earlei]|uniref:Cytochrome P450 n=1 Tax=Russula earlei TaxID=71964 RepID=A0ACC0UIW4_9AGAM|nr:cytochrome P450 [Russula earlei]